MPTKKANKGCGCGSIPISLIIVLLGVGFWGFKHLEKLDISQLLPNNQQLNTPIPTLGTRKAIANNQQLNTPIPTLGTRKAIPINNSPLPQTIPTNIPTSHPQTSPLSVTPQKSTLPQNPWQKKEIRGIYLSRYQITNNADEKTIRERVRYYHSLGINTIIQGVWGNGCTMYNSQVMQQVLGAKSCPNQFQEKWLDWLIDEAHKNGMEVHAYFEKGIKIDKNSPIFDLAIAKRWIVPGVDRTYPVIEHYVLDVELPEVADLFRKISVEFVQKYPTIDAVQWDDYLGYHAELPGKVDRTTRLTNFVLQMRDDIKKANPKVSFDICHHNPYWAKRYFAADWQNWKVDRVFIQVYNDANFNEELNYAENSAGVAITEKQVSRLQALVDNNKIKSILIFPASGKPEEAAAIVKNLAQKSN
jgi:uncharacterized lipoprotein YddW (UPF0748 family)